MIKRTALASIIALAPLLACAPPLEEGDPTTLGAPDGDTEQSDAPGLGVGHEPIEPIEPAAPPVEPDGPTVLPTPEGCPQVRVTSADGQPLRVRPEPSTAQEPLGLLPFGSTATVLGVVESGQVIQENARWYQIDNGQLTGFVSAAFSSCFDPSDRVPGFFLPLQCGTAATVTQGNNTNFSHNGLGAFAFDFAMPRGTPVVAMEDGVVIASIVNSRPGDPCYNGGGSSCASEVNHVVIQHPDGTTSRYAHLDEPTVNDGDLVLRGEPVGLSGTSGWSTGPHLHAVRMQSDCGSPWCQSIPVSFEDVGGDGVPTAGDVVTSSNCR